MKQAEGQEQKVQRKGQEEAIHTKPSDKENASVTLSEFFSPFVCLAWKLWHRISGSGISRIRDKIRNSIQGLDSDYFIN